MAPSTSAYSNATWTTISLVRLTEAARSRESQTPGGTGAICCRYAACVLGRSALSSSFYTECRTECQEAIATSSVNAGLSHAHGIFNGKYSLGGVATKIPAFGMAHFMRRLVPPPTDRSDIFGPRFLKSLLE